jgi:hypothetical protein
LKPEAAIAKMSAARNPGLVKEKQHVAGPAFSLHDD